MLTELSQSCFQESRSGDLEWKILILTTLVLTIQNNPTQDYHVVYSEGTVQPSLMSDDGPEFLLPHVFEYKWVEDFIPDERSVLLFTSNED